MVSNDVWNCLSCIKGEIRSMQTLMRLNARWAEPARFDTEIPLKDESPLIGSLRSLYESLEDVHRLQELDCALFLSPFVHIVISSDTNGIITNAALSSLLKFLLYGMITPSSYQSSSGMNLIATCVSRCVFEETDRESDEVVLMKLLELSSLCITCGAGVLIHPTNVWDIIQTCQSIRSQKACTRILRATAENALENIVLTLFGRLSTLPLSLNAFAKQALSLSVSDADLNGNDSSKIDREAAVTGNRGDSDEPAYESQYWDLIVKFTQSLCRLMTPNKNERSTVLLALSLLNTALESGGISISQNSRLLELMRTDVCKCLLQNSHSQTHASDLPLLSLTLRVVFNLFNSIRNYMKVQLEVFLTSIHIRILASSSSSPDCKEVVLASLLEFCKEPGLMHDIYVNYDCDEQCTDLFEIICRSISSQAVQVESSSSSSRKSRSVSGPRDDVIHVNILNRLAVECLMAIVQSIARNCFGITSGSSLRRNGNSEILNCDSMDQQSIKDLTDYTDTSPQYTENMAPVQLVKEDIQDRKRRKKLIRMAGDNFNRCSPGSLKWIEYAVKLGVLTRDSSKSKCDDDCEMATALSVAQFLKDTSWLKKTLVGEFLSKGPAEKYPYHAEVLKCYLDTFDFTSTSQDAAENGSSLISIMPFDGALRLFLSWFKIPGEAQCIDRFMESFAKRYFFQGQDLVRRLECNEYLHNCRIKRPDMMFKGVDAVFVLAFSTLMLHTDIHSTRIPDIKKMKVEEFVRNNRGINGGEDFPREYLETLYRDIQKNEMQVGIDIHEVSNNVTKGHDKIQHDGNATIATGTTRGSVEGSIASEEADTTAPLDPSKLDHLFSKDEIAKRKTASMASFTPANQARMQSLANKIPLSADDVLSPVNESRSSPVVVASKDMFGCVADTILASMIAIFRATDDDLLVVKLLQGILGFSKVCSFFSLRELFDKCVTSMLREAYKSIVMNIRLSDGKKPSPSGSQASFLFPPGTIRRAREGILFQSRNFLDRNLKSTDDTADDANLHTIVAWNDVISHERDAMMWLLLHSHLDTCLLQAYRQVVCEGNSYTTDLAGMCTTSGDGYKWGILYKDDDHNLISNEKIVVNLRSVDDLVKLLEKSSFERLRVVKRLEKRHLFERNRVADSKCPTKLFSRSLPSAEQSSSLVSLPDVSGAASHKGALAFRCVMDLVDSFGDFFSQVLWRSLFSLFHTLRPLGLLQSDVLGVLDDVSDDQNCDKPSIFSLQCLLFGGLRSGLASVDRAASKTSQTRELGIIILEEDVDSFTWEKSWLEMKRKDQNPSLVNQSYNEYPKSNNGIIGSLTSLVFSPSPIPEKLDNDAAGSLFDDFGEFGRDYASYQRKFGRLVELCLRDFSWDFSYGSHLYNSQDSFFLSLQSLLENCRLDKIFNTGSKTTPTGRLLLMLNALFSPITEKLRQECLRLVEDEALDNHSAPLVASVIVPFCELDGVYALEWSLQIVLANYWRAEDLWPTIQKLLEDILLHAPVSFSQEYPFLIERCAIFCLRACMKLLELSESKSSEVAWTSLGLLRYIPPWLLAIVANRMGFGVFRLVSRSISSIDSPDRWAIVFHLLGSASAIMSARPYVWSALKVIIDAGRINAYNFMDCYMMCNRFLQSSFPGDDDGDNVVPGSHSHVDFDAGQSTSSNNLLQFSSSVKIDAAVYVTKLVCMALLSTSPDTDNLTFATPSNESESLAQFDPLGVCFPVSSSSSGVIESAYDIDSSVASLSCDMTSTARDRDAMGSDLMFNESALLHTALFAAGFKSDMSDQCSLWSCFDSCFVPDVLINSPDNTAEPSMADSERRVQLSRALGIHTTYSEPSHTDDMRALQLSMVKNTYEAICSLISSLWSSSLYDPSGNQSSVIKKEPSKSLCGCIYLILWLASRRKSLCLEIFKMATSFLMQLPMNYYFHENGPSQPSSKSGLHPPKRLFFGKNFSSSPELCSRCVALVCRYYGLLVRCSLQDSQAMVMLSSELTQDSLKFGNVLSGNILAVMDRLTEKKTELEESYRQDMYLDAITLRASVRVQWRRYRSLSGDASLQKGGDYSTRASQLEDNEHLFSDGETVAVTCLCASWSFIVLLVACITTLREARGNAMTDEGELSLHIACLTECLDDTWSLLLSSYSTVVSSNILPFPKKLEDCVKIVLHGPPVAEDSKTNDEQVVDIASGGANAESVSVDSSQSAAKPVVETTNTDTASKDAKPVKAGVSWTGWILGYT